MKVREILEALQGVDPEYDVHTITCDGLQCQSITRTQVISAKIWPDDPLGFFLWID